MYVSYVAIDARGPVLIYLSFSFILTQVRRSNLVWTWTGPSECVQACSVQGSAIWLNLNLHSVRRSQILLKNLTEPNFGSTRSVTKIVTYNLKRSSRLGQGGLRLMCIFPTRYYSFLPFVFVGLFLLMMHNCISPALMEHMQALGVRCDGPLCWGCNQ